MKHKFLTVLTIWLLTFSMVKIVAAAVVDLNEGLVVHLEFEGNLQDTSGNGYHGVELPAVASQLGYSSGIVGKALHFPGPNSGASFWADFVDTKYDWSSKSFSYWVKPGEKGDASGLTSFWPMLEFWARDKPFTDPSGINTTDFDVRVAINDLRPYLSSWGQTSYPGGNRFLVYYPQAYAPPIPPNVWSQNWTHIAGTFDSSGHAILYVNGVDVAHSDALYSNTGGNWEDPTILREKPGNEYIYNLSGQYVHVRLSAHNHVETYLDDLRIYNRSLSPQEVYALANPQIISEICIESEFSYYFNDGLLTLSNGTTTGSIIRIPDGAVNSRLTFTIKDQNGNPLINKDVTITYEDGLELTSKIVNLTTNNVGQVDLYSQISSTFTSISASSLTYIFKVEGAEDFKSVLFTGAQADINIDLAEKSFLLTNNAPTQELYANIEQMETLGTAVRDAVLSTANQMLLYQDISEKITTKFANTISIASVQATRDIFFIINNGASTIQYALNGSSCVIRAIPSYGVACIPLVVQVGADSVQLLAESLYENRLIDYETYFTMIAKTDAVSLVIGFGVSPSPAVYVNMAEMMTDVKYAYDPDRELWIDGIYKNVVENIAGKLIRKITVGYTSANGAIASLTLETDNSNVPPNIQVNTPNENLSINHDISSIIVSGTSSDNSSIARVQYQINNSGNWITAQGTDNWQFTANQLVYGDNTIEIQAIDNLDVPSLIVTRVVTRQNPPAPFVAFSANTSEGINSLDVEFTAQIIGIYDSVDWNFGDGSYSQKLNPTHLYHSPGIYDVSLVVLGPGGTGLESHNNYIHVYTQVVANLSANKTTGSAPLEVLFTDSSSGDFDNWNWSFGDSQGGTAQNPVHVYDTAGVYSVALTINGGGGTDTITKNNYITVNSNNVPVVIAGSDQIVGVGETVNFLGSYSDVDSSDTHSNSWEFGDNSTTATNTLTPTHVYNGIGNYIVTFSVTDHANAVGVGTLVITVNPDNCPDIVNPDQANSDGDGYGDACDTFPNNINEWTDSDGDGIGDNYEADHSLNNLENDSLIDSDGDGYSNLREFLSGTDAIIPDIPLPIADNDLDNDVDAVDLALMMSEYGRTDCLNPPPCICDFDDNGRVDEVDLNLFTEDYGRAMDTDNDGILDDGDLSGIVGDFMCTGSQIANCDDNCITIYNPDQVDTNGDGVGDVCPE